MISNKINFHLGTIDVINSKTYDNILVKIDKNIRINEAKSYFNKLTICCNIHLSGFYYADKDPLVKKWKFMFLIEKKKRKNK